jgi:hypothetical protein
MRLFNGLTALLLAGVVLAGVVCAQHDLLGLAAQSAQATKAQQLWEKLEREQEIVFDRMRIKERVIADLLADRLTLLEAARWFKDLNESPADCQDNYRLFFPAPTAGESACRQVLAWAESALQESPRSHSDAVLNKLKQELQTHLKRHNGVVVLPTE